MRKIPTLFIRDPDDPRRVLPEVHPACRWVADGEGIPTRKYDGTCVMYDGQRWWTRREVKSGKTAPARFVAVEHDAVTGKTVGWEPAEQSAWWRFLKEAIDGELAVGERIGCSPLWRTTTYELCGPRVNRNPEGYTEHTLIGHDNPDVIKNAPRNYGDLREFLAGFPHEGIVWHHPDGRMAKIKRRDFATSTGDR